MQEKKMRGIGYFSDLLISSWTFVEGLGKENFEVKKKNCRIAPFQSIIEYLSKDYTFF